MAENRQTCSLTQIESIARAKSIKKNLDYKVFFNFNKGEAYKGLVFIQFELNDTDNVFLDFCGDKITTLKINGEAQDLSTDELYAAIHKDGHVYPDKTKLKTDTPNILEIHFDNRYYKDGNGLHTYVDVDGKQYLYIQSEPFWNNRVLPMFDQPNLKGRFTLNALIPEEWVLVTSVNPTSVTAWEQCNSPSNGLFGNAIFHAFKGKPLEGKYKYWDFPKSAILPTYLFSFVCGPYSKVELDEDKRYNNLPMALYCRESMVQFIVPQSHNIFEYNKRALEYYSAAFGMDYMFTKCDTIICPEFTIGAMEYPGAVTYSERLCPRGPNSIEQLSLRGKVIMHELAHMWFGDAVSIEWWNDTWLKESFADYACYQCAHDTADIMGFETSPAMNNFLVRKTWGYQEDFQSTSHPIAAEVTSTAAADGVFDGISYSKGAAVLKQLVFLIGMDNFKKAMKVYFERYAWGNTELKDLINVYKETLGELSNEHPALDVIKWSEDWLGTPGTNVLEVQWTNDSTKATIIQSAAKASFSTLRYHKIKIAFFNENSEIIRTQDVYVNNVEKTEVDLGDLTGVAAVLPNYEDHDFALITLDAKSREFFKKNLSKCGDDLTKTIIAKSFYDMVRGLKIKGNDFVNFIIEALDPSLTNYTFTSLFRFLNDILNGYVSEEDQNNYEHQIFQKILSVRLQIKDKKSEVAQVLAAKLISYAHANEDIDILHSIYKADALGFSNYELSITNKWKVVKAIQTSSTIPAELRKKIYDDLYEADKTDTKIQWKLIIDSALSRGEERQKIFADCIKENLDFSYHHLQYKLMGLSCGSAPVEERISVFTKFAESCQELINNRSRSIGKSFLYYFIPIVDQLQPIVDLIKKAAQHESNNQFTTKKLTQLYEDLELIIESRTKFQ